MRSVQIGLHRSLKRVTVLHEKVEEKKDLFIDFRRRQLNKRYIHLCAQKLFIPNDRGKVLTLFQQIFSFDCKNYIATLATLCHIRKLPPKSGQEKL